jgi:hypothetical protein
VSVPFHLRFPVEKVQYWADRYKEDDEPVLCIVTSVKQRGFLLTEEFQTACRWKTARSQSRCRKNPQEFVREVTKTSLSTPDEQFQIRVLTLLSGVGWPTASVILHFFHSNPYPILDFRALWSLNAVPPQLYHFDFWMDYTRFCRSLGDSSGVSMRTLDRALWQYSKENQP